MNHQREILVVLSVGMGGFFGAIGRYGVSKFVTDFAGHHLPWGTLTVNAIGSFLLGFIGNYLLHHMEVSPLLRLAITTGFMGAFTTFSTFSLETIMLVQEDRMAAAGINVLSNVVVCLSLCGIGMYLARAT